MAKQTIEVILHVTYDPEEFELDWHGLGRDYGIGITVMRERTIEQSKKVDLPDRWK